MADETLNNEGQAVVETQSNPAQDRIKQLSEKVELTAKERDEFKSLNENLTRENTFLSGFSKIVSTHPSATEHQDAIKEKVLKGYTVEDATYAVLGAAGKLGQAPAPAQVAGGSADTVMTQADKTPANMNQAERRAELEKQLIWS